MSKEFSGKIFGWYFIFTPGVYKYDKEDNNFFIGFIFGPVAIGVDFDIFEYESIQGGFFAINFALITHRVQFIFEVNK